jgi:hypothetical protein
LSLCFFQLIIMPWRRIGEWRYCSTHSLISAPDGGEWSASRTGHFTPRERAPGTPWIGGWVGPRAVLDTVVNRKTPGPHWESNSRTPIIQPVAQHYTDWAITALFISEGSSYIILWDHWCGIIVLNVHAPTEDKSHDMKDSIHEELEWVFDQFPKYHIKILLDFNANVGRYDISKLTNGNKSLHEIRMVMEWE